MASAVLWRIGRAIKISISGQSSASGRSDAFSRNSSGHKHAAQTAIVIPCARSRSPLPDLNREMLSSIVFLIVMWVIRLLSALRETVPPFSSFIIQVFARYCNCFFFPIASAVDFWRGKAYDEAKFSQGGNFDERIVPHRKPQTAL